MDKKVETALFEGGGGVCISLTRINPSPLKASIDLNVELIFLKYFNILPIDAYN